MGCCLPYDVTERELWLREGLVLTDDNRALFRNTAFYIFPGRTPDLVLDGEPLYAGPEAEAVFWEQEEIWGGGPA